MSGVRKIASRDWRVIAAVDYARNAGPGYDRPSTGPKDTPRYKPEKARLKARVTLSDPFAKKGNQ